MGDGTVAATRTGAATPAATPASPEVVVVGSLNLDLVVRVQRHPVPGETVLGGDASRHPGGKGANQAVAAARLGRRVAMVGCVGDDDAGRFLTDALAADRVDTAMVRAVVDTPTGMALITVDEHAENAIVVSPGANVRLTRDDVVAAAGMLAGAAVVLLQLEVPDEAVLAAAEAAAGTVVLNPAPARPLPAALLGRTDVLVPNRSELALLAGADVPSDLDGVAALARSLHGPAAVVVTLGAQGALVVDGGTVTHIPPAAVTPVDTTAAGDAFCGALADALTGGSDLAAAAGWAARVAGVAVTRHGAQPSLPRRDEVEGAHP